jgi:hypothetical protein
LQRARLVELEGRHRQIVLRLEAGQFAIEFCDAASPGGDFRALAQLASQLSSRPAPG